MSGRWRKDGGRVEQIEGGLRLQYTHTLLKYDLAEWYSGIHKHLHEP